MMKNSDISQKEQQIKTTQIGIDPKVILSLVLKNWYYFMIGIILSLIAARFYMGHTMPVYMSSMTILINETEERQVAGNEELLQGLGLPGGLKNIENQIMVLTSRALTEKALKKLPFGIEFYHKTIRNQLPVYPNLPVKIVSDKEIPLPRDTEFSILYLGNQKFQIQSESEYFVFQKLASFGEDLIQNEGSFRIECLDEKWLIENIEQKLYFIIYSSPKLTWLYNSRIMVEQLLETGSILKVSMTGTNARKDVDFLNTLAEVFQDVSLDKKNIEAIRRIQFIDDQLIGISDSLSITESKLQQFRSTHRVMDLSAQGQAIINQINDLENERARLNLEANYYDYLADYLAKEKSGELPIVPITMGINDPGLTRLVTELADLQGQLFAKGGGEMNPLQNMIVQKVRSTKSALLETLNGLRRANNLARNENQEQINKVNSQASVLPVTERQLLGIERKFKLNDDMYTFLLETRAEQQMQKASNMSDSEVIDPASVFYSEMISPDKRKVYLVGLLAGSGIPFSILFLLFIFNKKLKEEDLEKLADIPVVGYIPHSPDKINNVVFDSPNSSIAESFRLMRSRMQFFVKDVSSPIILITSSMPEEGKTFTSINLASVYSLLDKKTVLVGFDLRKPGKYADFELHHDKGISTYLIGKDRLEDVIQETSYINLSVITAGPVPPNPSELTLLNKTEELFKSLKVKFDIIIVDSSPIGIVSDPFHLASLADTCILVTRPGTTLKDILYATLREIRTNRLDNLSLVINDLQSGNYHQKYGTKYGYTNDKIKKKISTVNKRK